MTETSFNPKFHSAGSGCRGPYWFAPQLWFLLDPKNENFTVVYVSDGDKYIRRYFLTAISFDRKMFLEPLISFRLITR
jgi:hypothetical protein